MSRANFVQTKLAGAATAAATSLTVQSAGAAFALPPADGGFLTLTDSLGAPAAYEIVSYTSRTGSGPNYTLAGVARGVEGTVARDWPAGAFVLQSLTAGELDALLSTKAPASHTHTTAQVSGLGTAATKNITISTATPSGGVDGDIWIQY